MIDRMGLVLARATRVIDAMDHGERVRMLESWDELTADIGGRIVLGGARGSAQGRLSPSERAQVSRAAWALAYDPDRWAWRRDEDAGEALYDVMLGCAVPRDCAARTLLTLPLADAVGPRRVYWIRRDGWSAWGPLPRW